ncbi:hypothetical protein [Flaviflagellibacter deserti]|uniref:Uncharacterized protein n=1 Tax=Flaviflagellibacter deserti TaxID=2267266 RepID=A0ABV9Z300_9HYPH
MYFSSLGVAHPNNYPNISPRPLPLPEMRGRENSDEWYALNVCDEVLGETSARQHSFPFLYGDPGRSGRSRLLCVDAYYPSLRLVIEYCERQHSEAVSFFDKPTKLTCSGVHRGEQRRIYDERRRAVLPKHGITLREIHFWQLEHRSGRLLRNIEADRDTIRGLLVPPT